ncbi:MAG: stage II sporulation protein M [Bacillota bacterium]
MARLHLGTGFLAAVIIFTAGTVAGWAFSQAIAPLLVPSLENLIATAEKTMGLNPEIGHLALSAFIFLKNLSVTAILVFVGHVACALPAMFILVVNGLLVGLLARYFVEAGLPPAAFVAGIAPHGVIELPALFLAAGLALAIAAQRLKGGVTPGFGRRLDFLLRVVTPLLAAAAVVEVYITPLVINRFAP